jgi:hypothetical protein
MFNFINRFNKIFSSGAALDPRFKLDWVTSAGKGKSDVEAKIREELKNRLATSGIIVPFII